MLLLNCGFPQAKALPVEPNACPQKRGAPAADSLLEGLVGTGFGLESVLVRKGVSQGHTFAPEAVTSAPGEAQRRPKVPQSLVLGVPGRPFWRKFARVATLREPYYLPCFNDIRPPWGRPL